MNNEGQEVKIKTIKIEEIRLYNNPAFDLGVTNFFRGRDRADIISVSYQQKRHIYYIESEKRDKEDIENYLVIVYMG